MTTALPAEVVLLISLLEGIERARYLALAGFALALYEYCITLDREVEYFWSGPWTISRVLYIINRYIPPIIMILDWDWSVFLGLICHYSCTRIIRASFVANTFAMMVVQVIMVLRIWHIFWRNLIMRVAALCSVAACQIAALVELGRVFRILEAQTLDIPGLPLPGCVVPAPAGLWRLWVPALVLHTVFYLFTAAHAATRRNKLGKNNLVLNRVLRDGGVLYLAVLGSVGFSGIGSTAANNPSISVPAVYSNIMLSVVSVCMSRVMLSIHSLAANLDCDPVWLLNHLELSRVNWRKGSTDNEIVVEMEVVEPKNSLSMELGDSEPHITATVDERPFYGNLPRLPFAPHYP